MDEFDGSWHWTKLCTHDNPGRPVFDSTVTSLSSFRVLICGGYSPVLLAEQALNIFIITMMNQNGKLVAKHEIVTFERDRIEAFVLEVILIK